MADTITVQVTPQGIITLPKELAQSRQMRAGDTYTLLDLGDVFILCPRSTAVDTVADYIAEELRQRGVTLDAVLRDIREQREAYDPRA